MQRGVLFGAFEGSAVAWACRSLLFLFHSIVLIGSVSGAVPLGTSNTVVVLNVAFKRLLFFPSRHFF